MKYSEAKYLIKKLTECIVLEETMVTALMYHTNGNDSLWYSYGIRDIPQVLIIKLMQRALRRKARNEVQ